MIDFADTLALLVGSCERTGALNATGREVLAKVANRHLRNLGDLQAYVDAHPDVVDRPLEAPIVVTGLPRTGTSLLHNLLALDPGFRVLRFWEAIHPVPTADEAQARAQAERWLDRFHALVPDFAAVHRATATGPEECDALLQNSFASQHFDDMFDAPEYSDWLAGASLRRQYDHYALQLRVLSATSPPGTTWALKSPSHLGHLDALLATLPGATIVHCHRHPREAVASYASLVHTLRRAYCYEPSPATAGRHALTRAATAMDRALAVRASAEPAFVDVSYRTLVDDPIGAVGAVYERVGRPMGADLEARMRQWASANPPHRHGPHRYDLADFGLAGADVDAAFAAYLDRFAAAVC